MQASLHLFTHYVETTTNFFISEPRQILIQHCVCLRTAASGWLIIFALWGEGKCI